jgi:hypothetical protein
MEQIMESLVAVIGSMDAKSYAILKEIRASQEHLKVEIRAG